MTTTDDRPDHDLDAALRRRLEPDAATVSRVVRNALAAAEPETHRARPWRRATGWATAGAFALLAALAVPVLIPDAPVDPPVEPVPAPPQPSLLSISNESGVVTVTTPTGSKMIVLPGEPS